MISHMIKVIRKMAIFTYRLLSISVILYACSFAIYNYFAFNRDIPIDGYTEKGFDGVAALFREQLWSGAARGCALAVYHRGHKVVDMWGGYADYEFKIPWRNYTLANVASVTKGVAAISLALLAERKQLDYGRLVSDYWPEFSQNGKHNITVDMLLSHQTGLLSIEPPFPVSLLKAWADNVDKIDAILVKQKPAWPPGTQQGYEALSYGLYVDALIRHVDPEGRTASQFFHDKIAVPYDIDFYIGLPPALFYRMARTQSLLPKWSWAPQILRSLQYTKMLINSLTNPLYKLSLSVIKENLWDMSYNDPEYASIPWLSAHGFGTANAIAKMFSHLAGNDSKLLSPRVIDRLTEPLVSGVNRVLGVSSTYGRGFILAKNVLDEVVIAHMGYGGHIAFADPKRQLSFVYITNDHTLYSIGGDPKVTQLEKAVYDAITGSDEANGGP